MQADRLPQARSAAIDSFLYHLPEALCGRGQPVHLVAQGFRLQCHVGDALISECVPTGGEYGRPLFERFDDQMRRQGNPPRRQGPDMQAGHRGDASDPDQKPVNSSTAAMASVSSKAQISRVPASAW